MLTTIKEIYQQTEKLIEESKEIKVSGWVKSVRKGKEITFINLNDGSILDNLQITFLPKNFPKIDLLKKINFASSLVVSGKLAPLDSEKSCELKSTKIEFINSVDPDYPLQKKKIPLKVVRDYPHLRSKTNYFLAIFSLRNSISKAIHDFFHQEGFYYVSTPIITSNDTEGAGELFSIMNNEKECFFSKPVKLTVSGQLQAEALAQGLGKVYTFSPCFRAEKSHTTRHLAEFWMVESEMAFVDLEQVTNLAEQLIKYLIKYALDNNIAELEYLEKYNHDNKKIINKLKQINDNKFKFIKLSYNQSIEILKKKSTEFVFNDIKWGMDLQSEHEKYLCQHFDNSPVFVTNYPVGSKAFYVKNNSDGKTVACFDLLFPEIGELIGGSVREDNYQVLREKAQNIGLDISNLNWYFDLRKYGYAPSGGFGLGLERLIMCLSGTKNIRDVIAFPCYYNHLEH